MRRVSPKTLRTIVRADEKVSMASNPARQLEREQISHHRNDAQDVRRCELLSYRI